MTSVFTVSLVTCWGLYFPYPCRLDSTKIQKLILSLLETFPHLGVKNNNDSQNF